MLRSLMIGDCDHYFSPYIFGVNQGMSRLGHWHSQVNLRQDIGVIAKRVADVKPDILWTHMLLWAPTGSPTVDRLIALVSQEAKRGCKVIIHDGDYKEATRYPNALPWCSLALTNHRFSRAAWKCPTLYWPYFGFAQDKIASKNAGLGLTKSLFFAGTIRNDPTYAARSKLVTAIAKGGAPVYVPSVHDGNTLFRTAEIAASSAAVLGFGRPGVNGWVDTRVFQYIAAGGILLHDDVAGYFEPWVHYVPYASGNAASAVEAFHKLSSLSDVEKALIRERGFAHAQANHSSVVRCAEVLKTVGLA